MRAGFVTSVAALVLLLVGCDDGGSGGAGAGGSAGNPGSGEAEVLEPDELPDLPQAVAEISSFYFLGVEAFVQIEQGYGFSALRVVQDEEIIVPDSSCTWGLISDMPNFGGMPGSGVQEVGVLASLYRHEALGGVSSTDANDRFSFWRQGEGDTQWGLFDASVGERGEEWSSVPDGNEEMACVEFIAPNPEFVMRLCRVSWAGNASENFTSRKSQATVQLNCLFAREATPGDVPSDCSLQDDPCLLLVPDGEGDCTLAIPRDSTLSPIECELDGGLGMCVNGECVEHGCNGSCDDGDPATSDICQRPDSQSAWACEHDEI